MIANHNDPDPDLSGPAAIALLMKDFLIESGLDIARERNHEAIHVEHAERRGSYDRGRAGGGW